jgi:hypothetical protein
MQINLSEDRANKIKTSKSIRISLLEEERIAQMGMSVTEALRKGLDMVLNGQSAEPAPAVVKKSVDLDGLDHPVWLKHVGYLTTSESMAEIEKNWEDFVNDYESVGELTEAQVNFYDAEAAKLST